MEEQLNRKINKILIVEDEDDLRIGLSLLLALEGFKALEAADGEEALVLVEQYNPELLLLDIMMHRMSGIEVCRIIRSNAKFKDIKIIFVTAKSQKKDVKEAMEAGGDGYLMKPFEVGKLVEMIKKFEIST